MRAVLFVCLCVCVNGIWFASSMNQRSIKLSAPRADGFAEQDGDDGERECS